MSTGSSLKTGARGASRQGPGPNPARIPAPASGLRPRPRVKLDFDQSESPRADEVHLKRDAIYVAEDLIGWGWDLRKVTGTGPTLVRVMNSRMGELFEIVGGPSGVAPNEGD